MELRGRDRLVQAGADDEVADVGVGLEQHGRGKQDVVDPDHAVLVQLDVVRERRAAAQREVQRVVQIVVQIRAGRDDEVDEPAVHHLDDAAAEPGRRHRAGHRQPDRRVVLGREHLLGEDLARLGEPPGVERLKPFVDRGGGSPGCPSAGSSESVCRTGLLAGVPGRAGRAIRQRGNSLDNLHCVT